MRPRKVCMSTNNSTVFTCLSFLGLAVNLKTTSRALQALDPTGQTPQTASCPPYWISKYTTVTDWFTGWPAVSLVIFRWEFVVDCLFHGACHWVVSISNYRAIREWSHFKSLHFHFISFILFHCLCHHCRVVGGQSHSALYRTSKVTRLQLIHEHLTNSVKSKKKLFQFPWLVSTEPESHICWISWLEKNLVCLLRTLFIS